MTIRVRRHANFGNGVVDKYDVQFEGDSNHGCSGIRKKKVEKEAKGNKPGEWQILVWRMNTPIPERG